MRNNSANMGVVGGQRTVIVGSPVSEGGGGGGTLPVGGQFAEPQPQYASQFIAQPILQPELATQRWTFSPSGVLALNYYNLNALGGSAPNDVPSIESCMETSTSGIWTKDLHITGFFYTSDYSQPVTTGFWRDSNAHWMWIMIRGVVYDENGNSASNVVERTYRFIHSSTSPGYP